MKKKLLKADIGLLCDVMTNQCKSGDIAGQLKFANWIVKKLHSIDKNFVWKIDKLGNLYITKGVTDLYPCMVSHLDTVHNHVERFIIKRVGDFVIGFDNYVGEQVGCGADDRAGITIAIEMFRIHPYIKLFFPIDEEIGSFGSYDCDTTFFDNCCFMIQPDRSMYGNKRDYVNHTNGISVTTKEFDKEIEPILREYWYTPEQGAFTDIGVLSSIGVDICAFNLSCYLNAHSDQEVVWIPLYEDALNLVNDVITTMSHKQWKMPVRPRYDKNDIWSKYVYNDYEPVGKIIDEPDYFELAMEEAYDCPMQCVGDYTEIQLDNSIFCIKCQKTLGEKHLINENLLVKGKSEAAWESGWSEYYD